MSAEYIMAGGNPNVILCERGIRTFETATRNTLDLSAVPVLHSLTHLPVVVEGVETNEQANILRQMGARYAQGFLYHRPMPVEDFEILLDGGAGN